MRAINLIPPDRILRARLRRRRHRWAIGLACYSTALVLAGLGVRSVGEPPGEDQLQEMSRIQTRVDKAKADITVLEQTQASLAVSIEAALTAGDHPDWSRLLTALAEVRGTDILLNSAQIGLVKVDISGARAGVTETAGKSAKAPGGDASAAIRSGAGRVPSLVVDEAKLNITGIGRSPGSVFEFALTLERLGLFDVVRVKDTRVITGTDSIPTGSATFEIEATVRGLAPGNEPSGTASPRASGVPTKDLPSEASSARRAP